MAKFDPIRRREELRGQLDTVIARGRQHSARVDEIGREEDVHYWEESRGRRRPGAPLPGPAETNKALAAARIEVARGEGDPGEVQRLEKRAAVIEAEVADIVAAIAEDNGALAAIKRDIVELHREHLDAFAEHAEKRVAEVQRLAEELAPLLDQYGEAWEAAAEAWAEPAADNGLPVVGRCPVPTGAAVRGMVPRPEGIRPDEAEAA